MAKILADTNFLLDMMIPGRPDAQAAYRLFAAMDEGRVDMAVCAGSLKDSYYIARRDMADGDRRMWLRIFTERIDLFPLDSTLCRAAIASDEPDFEDALIRTCAEWWRADYILSRDAKAFANSSIPRIEASQLVNLLGI